MRELLRLSLAVGCFMLATAFTFTSNVSTASLATDPGTFKIMEVTYLWDLLKSNYEPNRERDQTWLDVGLRSKYAMAKNYASLELLEQTFGEQVFLRGPHGTNMDFESTTSFGYYNPAFIASVHQALETALQNPMFKPIAKSFYEKNLKSMAHTYRDAYDLLVKNPDIKHQLTNKYLLDMARPNGTVEGSLQESFRGYAEAAERGPRKADIYESFTAPSFWLRRHIDGTAGDLKGLLDMAIGHLE